MASPPTVPSAARELDALLAAARSGRPRSVYLFAGESFHTRTAAHALLDALVPQARRAFNFETYEGRTTPIATVLDSVRTPGFFPGPKVVWVRESPMFLSGEKRSELTKALLAAWGDGREPEAAEKLLALLALAGWTQEQLVETRWATATKTRVREVFGEDLDAAALVQLDGVTRACLARGLTVSAYRDDSGMVVDFLGAGLPAHAVLLFTASAVDARKRLVKRLREVGAVVDFTVARERSGAITRETIDDLIQRGLREHGKQLRAEARDLIVRRAGTDPALLAVELEKLCLYVGDQPAITADDVRAVVRDLAESWIFDFTSAFATRQLGQALPLLRGLFAQGELPLRLLAMIAREVRLLLIARECLDGTLRGTWRANLPFNTFQSRVLPELDGETLAAFGKAHPFVLYRRFQDAAPVTARALRSAVVKLSDLDVRLKSSGGDPEILLEAFVIDWCRSEG